ncbi:TRAP transporter substrate-binding protein [Roseomonas sp. NAR14]|uniref:TRAP transporter substrate-binding protein n=1 Tax=Roseomonas acroporae TaxID=2937791 RepID=A0A9X2BU46_9PROT|nr:TRAP transporter substrate-binding protein [Roseomonas acroporae]MCK8785308.1 TRAP transporter substrate-binding protein [Roseomonas acroporae]
MSRPVPRRAALAAGAALVLPAILPGRGHAQGSGQAQHTLKFANNLPDTHPLNIRAREAAERVARETSGRVAIQVFPNSQLGSDTDTLSQVRSGAVELFTLSGLILATLVPAASINGVGFAFPDYATVWKAMDGPLGAWVRGQINRAGLVVMDRIWDNGFRQITSSTRPIATPDDLRGFKIRVPVSPLWTSMFRAFEAAPASINFNEVYSALQTRIVEGQENPLALIETARLYEVQKYCSLTNHMWDGFWLLANRRAWERLPADAREITARALNEGAVAARRDTEALNGTVQAQLQSKGLTFNTVSTDAFRDRLRRAGFYAEWKGKYGDEAWGLLQQAVGELG